MQAIIYTRVSTEEQAQSGLGLQAQLAKCTGVCAARGWTITSIASDEGVSGKVPAADRPAFSEGLRQLCASKAGTMVLVVSKLDRLARSAFDLLWLRREAERCGFALLILDPEVDTTTPAGRFQFTVMAGVAELERDLIAQRTKEALAAKKARGARLGRPITLPAGVRARVGELRATSLSMAKVAEALNAEGLTQGNGAAWTKSAVARVLRSLDLDAQAST